MPPKTKKKPPQQQDAAAASAATAPAAPAPIPKQQAKARTIQAVLDHLYPDPPIPLDHTDNFTLLIAVILSAQTTDGKVNQVCGWVGGCGCTYFCGYGPINTLTGHPGALSAGAHAAGARGPALRQGSSKSKCQNYVCTV